ncbi:MAG: ribosome biogenesis GTPase Der [Bdellovibrionales bacterium RBG_16_40_8]|nr:MAG: ribosome biogenesis GTPase Der [Bdellovibrionales bacterium RBG_16_40_8]
MSLQTKSSFRVAIIGRPNVGKSTLFNGLTRSRKAVVKNQPGVTRDIIVGRADWWGKTFEVLDTGGITAHNDQFSPLIYKQVLSILKYVDLLVVVMDARSGLLPEDRDIVRIAKESGRDFFIVVNKVDRDKDADLLKAEFYEFGMPVLHAAFERSERVDEIVEKISEYIPENLQAEVPAIRLAIVGKPNVGKSSLCNYLVGEKRVLVSEIAGTTVDAIEMSFSFKNNNFILVDTAGLRRSAKRWSRGDGVEILSSYKSFEAIDHADMVFLVMDATHGPTEQDAKMAEYIFEKGKALIVVANKMDLLKDQQDEPRKWFRERLSREFHFAPNLPMVFTSAESGEGLTNLLEEALSLWQKLHFKVSTRELNDFFYNVIRQAPSPVYRTTNVKFYYCTQTGQLPPSFIAFANHPEGVTPSYRRFLIKRIQHQWGLEGVPVRVFVMKSN